MHILLKHNCQPNRRVHFIWLQGEHSCFTCKCRHYVLRKHSENSIWIRSYVSFIIYALLNYSIFFLSSPCFALVLSLGASWQTHGTQKAIKRISKSSSATRKNFRRVIPRGLSTFFVFGLARGKKCREAAFALLAVCFQLNAVTHTGHVDLASSSNVKSAARRSQIRNSFPGDLQRSIRLRTFLFCHNLNGTHELNSKR